MENDPTQHRWGKNLAISELIHRASFCPHVTKYPPAASTIAPSREQCNTSPPKQRMGSVTRLETFFGIMDIFLSSSGSAVFWGSWMSKGCNCQSHLPGLTLIRLIRLIRTGKPMLHTPSVQIFEVKFQLWVFSQIKY